MSTVTAAWPVSASIIPPGPGEARIWTVDLEPGAAIVDGLVPMLSPDEQERAARFHFRRDAMRWIVARASLREILGRCLDADPRAVGFTYGDKGKPALAAPTGALDLQFSLAHSAHLALYAVTLDCPVGVDVERLRPVPEMDRIAERTFSRQECAALRGLPVEQRAAGFFNCWTTEGSVHQGGRPRSIVSARPVLGLARAGGAGAAAGRRERPRPRRELDDGRARAPVRIRGGGRGRSASGGHRTRAVGGEPPMTAAEFVAHLRALDVRLSVDGDRLRCSAPKGVLTGGLRDELPIRKGEILEWLREHGEKDGADAPAGREPASSAQQRLWFMDQLSPGGFAYNITGGLRILGDVERRGARA